MLVHTSEHEARTSGQGDIVDVTGAVQAAITACGAREGLATVFVTGSTAGVTAIEFESGVVADLDGALEKVAPRDGEYRHHLRWGDDNGSSHVRAGIVGPSLSIPFRDGQLLLGTWQQIVLAEFDTRGRTRRYLVQVMGEQRAAPGRTILRRDAASSGCNPHRPCARDVAGCWQRRSV